MIENKDLHNCYEQIDGIAWGLKGNLKLLNQVISEMLENNPEITNDENYKSLNYSLFIIVCTAGCLEKIIESSDYQNKYEEQK